MKEKRLLKALGQVDQKYIEEAAPEQHSKKADWLKWGVLAACFAIVAVVGLGLLLQSSDLMPSHQGGETMIENSSFTIHCLSESGTIESKTIEVQNTPKDIFDEWTKLNNISDVKFVNCVYDDYGTERTQGGSVKRSTGGYSSLSLTVSGEFPKYASDKNGVLLIETLRRTFYDYNRFDELNLMIQNLTDSKIFHDIVEPGMQADDGKSLVWEGISEREIDGAECYTFELRYSEDESINGEMAGRLLGIYAVSKDGVKFYQYNMADDTWE